MGTQKKQIDRNASAFEKSLESFEPAYYGTFTDDELQTMRKFFDLNTEAQDLGNRADSVRQEVELIEVQITEARRQYAGLIQEGRVDDATAAVSQIPSLRKQQEALRGQIPPIAGRLDEIEQAVAAIDHSKYLELAKQAATAAEQSRCRAVSIFGRPSDVRKTISDARSKTK